MTYGKVREIHVRVGTISNTSYSRSPSVFSIASRCFTLPSLAIYLYFTSEAAYPSVDSRSRLRTGTGVPVDEKIA